MLQIFNSFTRSKEEFKPLVAGKVRMYVCGMTVYDYCHIGHARVLVSFDVVARYLRCQGYDVNYVRNITDIDDKIIARANERGIDFTQLTAEFIEAMQEDSAALNVVPPNEQPCATAYIQQMLDLISTLIDKDKAYVAENGDVCYSVKNFASYGQLSHKDLDGLRAGARVETQASKRDPLDFVLWKLAKPGEPQWDSPWGAGRPGWHIECSAMSMCNLGETIDIHGGGSDLQFPHHENEIAQAEGATDKKFVNTWMHVGFVQVNSEKMSKSLGNFFTIREVLEKYPAEVIRYFMVSSHYRSPLNYSDKALDNAKAALTRFYTALRGIKPVAKDGFGDDYRERFKVAMDDDFNTPEALAVLFDIASNINKNRDSNTDEAAALAALLLELGGILGIAQNDPESFLSSDEGIDVAWVEAQIAKRTEARTNKDWALSDQIRDELLAEGVVLEDAAGETTWRRQ